MGIFTKAKPAESESEVKLTERIHALELEMAELTAEMTKFQRDLARTMRKVYRTPGTASENQSQMPLRTPNFPYIPGMDQSYPMGGTD